MVSGRAPRCSQQHCTAATTCAGRRSCSSLLGQQVPLGSVVHSTCSPNLPCARLPTALPPQEGAAHPARPVRTCACRVTPTPILAASASAARTALSSRSRQRCRSTAGSGSAGPAAGLSCRMLVTCSPLRMRSEEWKGVEPGWRSTRRSVAASYANTTPLAVSVPPGSVSSSSTVAPTAYAMALWTTAGRCWGAAKGGEGGGRAGGEGPGGRGGGSRSGALDAARHQLRGSGSTANSGMGSASGLH